MKEQSDIKDRFRELIENLKLTAPQFEEECGLGTSFVTRVTRNVQKKSLNKIKARYPKVNINWLKTGRGSMYSKVKEEDSDTVHDRLTRFSKFKGVSLTQMERDIGAGGGTLTRKKSSLRLATVMKMKEVYPDLNTEWLMYGTGKMISYDKNIEGTNILDRLRTFISTLGVSEFRFLSKCELPEKKVSELDKKLSTEYLDKIHAAYPSLNMEWLTKNKGEMIMETSLKASKVMMIPVVSQLAYAGYLGGYGDREYISSLPTIPYLVDNAREKYIAFEVKGDSMDDDTPDAYKSGDILICKQLELSLYKDSPLPYKKKDFVIVHKNGILIKRIIDHDLKRHTITIHSLSDDPTYMDRVLDLADVRQMFTVEYSQRKRSR